MAAKESGRRGAPAEDISHETTSPNAKRGGGTSSDSVPVRDSPVRSPILAAAAELVAQGWSVFPVASHGKKPVGPLVRHGLKDASQDLAKIADWWRAYPTGNLGAVPPAGCYVVDVDVYKNAALQALVDRLSALHTPMQRSGGGGLHFLLRGEPPSAATLCAVWGKGIEVKAHGEGYILAAPSVHPGTGAFYEWGKPCTIAPADTPDWLVRDAPKTKPDAKDDRPPAPTRKEPIGLSLPEVRAILDHLPFNWCDDRPQWFRAVAAVHHESGGSAEGLALAVEYSQRSANYVEGDAEKEWPDFGKPGRNDFTMRTLLSAAQRTGWKAPRTIAAAVRDFDARNWLSNAKAGRFDLAAVPPMAWLFDGIAPVGKVLVLAGAGGSSKSFFAYALAAHWVARKTFDVFVPIHRAPDSDEVLLLFAEEDEGDLHRRFAATVRAGAFDAEEMARIDERLLVRSMLDMDDVTLAEYEPGSRSVVGGQLFDLLRCTLQQRPTIRWIVADPLALLHQLEENDNGGMAKLLRQLGRMAAEFGVAIWLVHHFSKSGAEADQLNARAVRGASAIVDNARAALLMQRLGPGDAPVAQLSADQTRRLVRLTFGKNSHGDPLEPRYLCVRDDGSVEPSHVQPMPVPAGVAREMRKRATQEQATEYREQSTLRAVLLLLQKGPLGVNAIYEAKPAGHSRKIVRPVLDLAEEDGFVAVVDGPRNSKLYSLTPAGRMHIDGESL